MLKQFRVTIPKSEWPDIERFLTSDPTTIGMIVGFISASGPTPDIEDIAEACSESIGCDTADVIALLTIAVNLSRLKRLSKCSIQQILDGTAESLAQSKFEKWDATSWKLRQDYLESLLNPDGAVEIMSKARELLYNFQSILIESAVLTDVRQIFNNDATAIMGGLVLHTLSLEMYEDQQTRQAHVVLSNRDLDVLIEQLQRAQRKALVSTDQLHKLAIPELTPKRS